MARPGGNPDLKGKKGRSGRKSLRHEMALADRYQLLTPKIFRRIEKLLDSEDEKEVAWAMEWLKTGIVKMIPQKIGGDPDDRTPIPIYGNLSLQKYDSDTEDIQPN